MRDLTKIPEAVAEMKKITDAFDRECEELRAKHRANPMDAFEFFTEHEEIQRRSTERLKALIKKYREKYPDEEDAPHAKG